MSTTPDEVYRRIRADIGTAIEDAGLGDPSRVAVVVDDNPDLSDALFVQVRPAGGQMGTPRVGSQLADDVVEVTTWVRKSRDEGGKRTFSIAGETDSLTAVLETIRAPLRNSWLDGILEVPLKQVSFGNPVASPLAPHHFSIRDRWTCSYELAGGQAYMGWSATAPTALASLTGSPIGSAVGIVRETATSQYIWALVPQTDGDVLFYSEAGLVSFYSDTDTPPSGPTCSTTTIDGVVYRQWRSPNPSHGATALYRVRRA